MLGENRTVISRLTYTNWGNSIKSHELLTHSDKSNLYTGENGSGKSTTLDALQVVLYGSASSRHFNTGKKTNSKEKKRSALSYLRGARKNYVPVRENVDFWGNIVAEFYDLDTNKCFCGGVVFKVARDETEGIPEHRFFTVNGKIPEDEFINYTYDDLEAFVKARETEYANERPFVCKIYSSDNNYAYALMDKVFGGVDLDTFIKLQKASIAAEMPENSSVEDFIKTYLFIKPESNSCESMIRKAKSVKDMAKMLEIQKEILEKLNEICEEIEQAEITEKELKEENAISENVKAIVYNKLIEDAKLDLENLTSEKELLEQEQKELDKHYEIIIKNISETNNALTNSEYGLKKEILANRLEAKKQKERDEKEWGAFLSSLSEWFKDSDLPLPPKAENIYDQLKAGDIREELIVQLKKVLTDAHNDIEEEFDDIKFKRKDIRDEINQLNAELEALKKDEYNYKNGAQLKSVQRQLKDRLSMLYQSKIEVDIFSRTFEITDDEWRNAIEGRLAAKAYLIVAPQYYDVAHREFKKLHTKGIHLIDSKKMVSNERTPKPNSLYECVKASNDYVDSSLKYYLGNIIKCESIEDFSQCENGVMKDCFSYNQRSSYELKEEDYTKFASIGLKVSKKVINEKEKEIEIVKEKQVGIEEEYNRLSRASLLNTYRDYNSFDLYEKGKSTQEINVLLEEINHLTKEIEVLENGDIQRLNTLLEELKEEKGNVEKQRNENLANYTFVSSSLSKTNDKINNYIEEAKKIFVSSNETVVHKADEWYKKYCKKNTKIDWVVNERYVKVIKSIEESFEKVKNKLMMDKRLFLNENPTFGFDDTWTSNTDFKEIRTQKNNEFKETELVEFNKLYLETVEELQNHVIDQLNRDIKNAQSHKTRINAQLQQHTLGRNYFRLEISGAKDEYGQFYNMLTSNNLNFKPHQSEDGQLDFADISLEADFGKELEAFVNMFIPPDEEDYGDNTNAYERAEKEFREKLDKITDYRTYLKFEFKTYVDKSRLSEDSKKALLDSVSVDRTAGVDSGGEEVSPKYIALLLGFKMLYESSVERKSKFSLVMMDESFDKLDEKRTKELLSYARELGLQLIISVPDKEGRIMQEWINRTLCFSSDIEERSLIQQFERKELIKDEE